MRTEFRDWTFFFVSACWYFWCVLHLWVVSPIFSLLCCPLLLGRLDLLKHGCLTGENPAWKHPGKRTKMQSGGTRLRLVLVFSVLLMCTGERYLYFCRPSADPLGSFDFSIPLSSGFFPWVGFPPPPSSFGLAPLIR